MIQTTDLFHSKANAGIRPLDWGVGISWQKQETTSPQLLKQDGYATPSGTSFWGSITADSAESLGSGWGRFKKESPKDYTDIYPSNLAIDYETSTEYTVLVEVNNLENVRWINFAQSSAARSPFIDNFSYVFSPNEFSARFVKHFTTRDSLVSNHFGLRLFVFCRTAGQPQSIDVRATIVKGWVDEDEIEWQPYGRTTYSYESLKNRAIAISVSRSFDFPYNIQSAIADLSLDNHDGYLSFSGLNVSPIADYILPNRPVKIKYGFRGSGLVPNFNGFTESMPEYDGEHDSIAKFTALDRLAQISEQHLPNMVMMRDARTDEVLKSIFEQLGVSEDEYELEVGANIIPFVYFDADKSVGNALKELIQAENGRLWQDEEGVIRFTKRQTNAFAKDPVMVFTKSNTLSITPSRSSGIINQVNVSAEIRQIENLQQVYLVTNDKGYESSDDNYRVPANGQATVWLSFDDPIWSCIEPTLNAGASTSNFTAVDLSGVEISSGITAKCTLFATTYKVVFTNTNSSPVSIKSIALWGEPAKLIGGQAVEFMAYDDTSVAKFGTQKLDITENKCFGSVANLRQYANDIISTRADYNKQLTMTVKGDPALQLGDIVEISINEFEGRYQVLSIKNTMDNISESKLETELELQFVMSSAVTPFILNKSVLDGPDLLG